MRAVFIVGTGRSGTHFTIRLMRGFANAWDPLEGRENKRLLADLAKAAIGHRAPSAATRRYYQRLFAQAEGVALDQHHPNLFFAEDLARAHPGVVFLYPARPAHQIVASMLRHQGVMRWYDYVRSWRRLLDPAPFPNQFLGLDSAADIERLPPHLLCARRVVAHHRAFRDRRARLGAAMRAVPYEAMVADPGAAFEAAFTSEELRALGPFRIVEPPRAEGLSKYRDVLSDAQVDEIRALEEGVAPAVAG